MVAVQIPFGRLPGVNREQIYVFAELEFIAKTRKHRGDRKIRVEPRRSKQRHCRAPTPGSGRNQRSDAIRSLPSVGHDAHHHRPDTGSNMHILIAGDHAVVRRGLSEILADALPFRNATGRKLNIHNFGTLFEVIFRHSAKAPNLPEREVPVSVQHNVVAKKKARRTPADSRPSLVPGVISCCEIESQQVHTTRTS